MLVGAYNFQLIRCYREIVVTVGRLCSTPLDSVEGRLRSTEWNEVVRRLCSSVLGSDKPCSMVVTLEEILLSSLLSREWFDTISLCINSSKEAS